MNPLVLASGNPDKAREVCEVLSDVWDTPIAAWAVEVGGVGCFVLQAPGEPYVAPAVTEAPDVAETGATLLDNARIKARAWARALGLRAVADDTGLFVDALGGAPGVRSARYAGDDATYADNVDHLLSELRDVDASSRGAHFATVALAVDPDGRELAAEGAVSGSITREARGDAGFGYDPVFVPDEGDGRTFAEMDAVEKHTISHRGRAFTALARELQRADEGGGR